MSEQLRAVLYTDGGCKPSRGIGGWGVHGYFFDEAKPKVGTGQKDWLITPTGYVDVKAPMKNADWLAKWGELKELAQDPKVKNVNVVEYLDHYGSLIPESTNNIAELTAMTRAITAVVDKNTALKAEGKEPVLSAHIITDSRYVKDGLENWVKGWAKNGWVKRDGQPVANGDYWRTLVELETTLKGQGTTIILEWIKGHAGEQEGVERDNLGNGLADHYASLSIIAGRKGVKIDEKKVTEAKGYWKPKVEVNRLFAHSRWYFNTDSENTSKTPKGQTIYHLGDHGKDDDFLGKRMADASFAVLYLKEPEPALEKLREHQKSEDTEGHNSIMISRLDFAFKPTIYPMLLESGGVFLQRRSHKLDLYDAGDLQITKELRPPRLAFNLVDVMSVLESLLQKATWEESPKGIQKTDITSLIYELGEKKGKATCKIRPEFTSAVKSLSATVKNPIQESNTEIPLTLGMDLPHRNALSALAARHPKVSVVTWKESAKAFRYATVVEVEEDVGIFAGFYSNIHLLT